MEANGIVIWSCTFPDVESRFRLLWAGDGLVPRSGSRFPVVPDSVRFPGWLFQLEPNPAAPEQGFSVFSESLGFVEFGHNKFGQCYIIS